MAKKTLIQEAIADAKQVREVALENAKMALEEAFAPHLKSMLSKRLKESEDAKEGEYSGDDAFQKDPDGYSGDDADSDEYEKVSEGAQSVSPSNVTDVNKYAKITEDEDVALDSSDIGDTAVSTDDPGPKDPSDSSDSSDDIGEDGHTIEGGHAIEEGVDDEDDMDLDSVLRDLDSSGEDEEEGEEDFGDDEPSDDDSDDESDDDSDDHITGGVDDTTDQQAPETPAAPEASVEHPDSNKDEDEDEINLEEILRDLDDEDSSETTMESRKLSTENTHLKGELKEHRQAIKFLRSKLQEINLLNAKLLYTNKLFKNYNLTGGQKMKIVENFDRASTVREVKLVFATLAESYRGGSVKKRPVNEAFSSRPIRSTKPNTETKVITEHYDFAERMKKLAGITKYDK